MQDYVSKRIPKWSAPRLRSIYSEQANGIENPYPEVSTGKGFARGSGT